MRRAAAACAVAVLGLAVVPVARAAAPSGAALRLADARPIPIEYFQGLTHDPPAGGTSTACSSACTGRTARSASPAGSRMRSRRR